ncbi:MAG: 30S ribosomal protein S8, partial [Anaerolinea sp.]|nr:30S ribosomal protein S8 [Anaerolinea sp.]
MSVNDPIADMLTRVRNGTMNGQPVIAMPNSKIKAEIARVLKEEGFIDGYEVVDGDKTFERVLRVRLKYVG